MKITPLIKAKLEQIAEIGSYGLEWVQDVDPAENHSYRLGAVETVGHMIACMLAQGVTSDSEPTSDVIAALKLHEAPTRSVLLRRLCTYVRRDRPLGL